MHRFCVLLLLIWVLYVSCDIITCTSDHHYVLADDSGDIGCSSYGDRLNITWLITSSDNARRILLSFSQFDTEANYDFVSIYDGSSISAPSLGRYSGSLIPGPFASSGNSLYVVFTADQYVEGGGFSAHYSNFEIAQGVTPCTESVNNNLQGGSGNFGCDGYQSNLDVSWLITGDSGERIVLSFLTFNTERNYDIVHVYDGANSNAEQIGTFSGSDIPPPLTASGNQLYIAFHSDYSITSIGFTASWSSVVEFADPCYNDTSTILLTREGYIGCPYGYGNDVHSSWLIAIIGNYIVQLNFLSLQLEQNYDYVHVYDGANAESSLIGSYTGSTLPSTIVSSGNRLFVLLESDSSVTNNGFTASYQSVHALQEGGCSRSGSVYLTAPEDTLGCLGYLSGVTEEWHLEAQDQHQVINLVWQSFDIEEHDYVYVYDGDSEDSTLIYSVTGTTIPDPVVSSGQYLLVKFVAANNNVQGSGFSAVYQSIVESSTIPCSVSHNYFVTGLSGQFGCDGYDANVVMSWQIHVNDGYRILLSFDTFFTELFSDFVEIYDGPDSTYTNIGSFSGPFHPADLTSSSNYLYVKFSSDASVQKSGFSVTYTAVHDSSDATSCYTDASHTLSDNNGSFGCLGYAANVDVSWSITTSSGTVVGLEFITMDTEYNYDFIKVYDGLYQTNTLLLSASGTDVPDAVRSTSNKMLVVFTSDDTFQNSGFQIHYEGVTEGNAIPVCSSSTSTTLTDGRGVFGCSGYVNSIDSNWLIQVDQSQRIILNINQVDTEQYYDYIQVYDGSNSLAPAFSPLSGSMDEMTSFTSTGHTLYVTFHSDSSMSTGYTGFVAEYLSYGSYDVSCTSSGSYSFTAATGDLGCDGYSNNIAISWSISSFGHILLTFDTIDTEANYDTITIYDGPNANSNVLAVYSGNQPVSPVTSTGNNMFVQFSSDMSIHYTGFAARYITVST